MYLVKISKHILHEFSCECAVASLLRMPSSNPNPIAQGATKASLLIMNELASESLVSPSRHAGWQAGLCVCVCIWGWGWWSRPMWQWMSSSLKKCMAGSGWSKATKHSKWSLHWLYNSSFSSSVVSFCWNLFKGCYHLLIDYLYFTFQVFV